MGAVMMARAQLYGLKAEYGAAATVEPCPACGVATASALGALRCGWQCGAADKAEAGRAELKACLTELAEAVGEAAEARQGAFHTALSKGSEALRRAAAADPEEEGDEQAAIAVLGGMLWTGSKGRLANIGDG